MSDIQDKRSRVVSPKKKIPIVIVESHNHVLEHIHAWFRKNHCHPAVLDGWSMLHYDAHPDLAVPHHIPARYCFRPYGSQENNEEEEEFPSLYERLDQQSSGIAEWILPLAVATKLQGVQWMRPETTSLQQLQDGFHNFQVGCYDPCLSNDYDNDETSIVPARHWKSFWEMPDTARIGVDWGVPYYLETDVVTSARDESHGTVTQEEVRSSVVANERLSLRQPMQLFVGTSLPSDASNVPYMLDVCLDYFACRNPYVIPELETDLVPILHSSKGVLFLQSSTNSSTDTLQLRDQFERTWTEWLQLEFGSSHQSSSSSLNNENHLDMICNQQFYKDPSQMRIHYERLIQTIRSQTDEAQVSDMIQSLIRDVRNLLTMPHDLHDDSVTRLQQFASHDLPSPPFFISMARSYLDEFTPSILHTENLQLEVLQHIQERYCQCPLNKTASFPCTNCFHLVKDYGEWEGSVLYE